MRYFAPSLVTPAHCVTPAAVWQTGSAARAAVGIETTVNDSNDEIATSESVFFIDIFLMS